MSRRSTPSQRLVWEHRLDLRYYQQLVCSHGLHVCYCVSPSSTLFTYPNLVRIGHILRNHASLNCIQITPSPIPIQLRLPVRECPPSAPFIRPHLSGPPLLVKLDVCSISNGKLRSIPCCGNWSQILFPNH